MDDLQIDITSREFKADSDRFYAQLRREAPVYRTVLPDKQVAWIVTRYDDVAMVLKDERALMEEQLMSGYRDPVATSFEQAVYPEHARLTDLGIKFCQNIDSYREDTGKAGGTL